MTTLTKCIAALTLVIAITSAPAIAQAYTRTIMGYAAQPILVPDATLVHDDFSGLKAWDYTQRHQVLYPVALDQIGGAFSAKVAVTADTSAGGEVLCWAIAYRADGTWTDVKAAQTVSDGFQELNIPAVTVPADGYGSVSCWLKAGRVRNAADPTRESWIIKPVRIHRVMVQQ